MQTKGFAYLSLVPLLVNRLNDGLILVLGDSTWWCKVDLLKTSEPSVALVFDRTPTLSERPDCVVGENSHIVIVVLLYALSKSLLCLVGTGRGIRRDVDLSFAQSFVFLGFVVA